MIVPADLSIFSAHCQYIFPFHAAAEEIQCTPDGHIHPVLPQFFNKYRSSME